MKLLAQKFRIYAEIDKTFHKQVLSLKQYQGLAKKLGLSERQFYRYLEQMEDLGAPIGYVPEAGGYTYKGKYRVAFLINSNTALEMPANIYKLLSDKTLKKIKLYNTLDELIYSGKVTTIRQLTIKLKKHYSMGLVATYNLVYTFREMGAPLEKGKLGQLAYQKGKRLNFIIRLVKLNEG